MRSYRRASKEAKKRYNRRHSERLNERRANLVHKFGDVCYICNGRADVSPFEFHHVTYRNGNPYQQFKGRRRRLEILREIEKHPENFRMTHRDCHKMVETLVRRFDKIGLMLERLDEVARLTVKLGSG